MNILFVDQFSALGGAQQCLLDLLPAIQNRGWRAYVAAPGTGPLMDRVRSLGIECHRLGAGDYTSGRKTVGDIIRFARDFPRAAAQLRRLVRDLSIDLVYVNGPRVLPAAAFVNRPIVFHAHSVVTQPLAGWLAVSVLRRRAPNVIAASEYAAARLRSVVPPDRMHVIYNGVRDLRFMRRGSGNPWRVGFIGRIAPEKGALDFVRAARLVADSRRDVQFVVCGSPLFSDISYGLAVKAEARELPVTFWGWQDDASEVLRSLDLMVVPSGANDAAPRVILEAFSAGVPVVAYPSGGIPELVDPSAGLLVPERTPECLAVAVRMLLDRPEQRRDMGVSARRLWAARFQVERYSEEIVRVLERFSPGRAGPAGTLRRQSPRRQRPQGEPGHIQTAAH